MKIGKSTLAIHEPYSETGRAAPNSRHISSYYQIVLRAAIVDVKSDVR